MDTAWEEISGPGVHITWSDKFLDFGKFKLFVVPVVSLWFLVLFVDEFDF